MATNQKNPSNPPGPKKPANPILAEAQRRAAARASSGKRVSARQFFQEAWVELKKTSWPSRSVLTKSTYVVLGFVVATAIWVGGLDYLLTHVVNPLFAPSGR